MERFALNKETGILIYGAAAGGTILFQKMRKKNYRILGFVDQRSEEISSLFGLPVYGIEQVRDLSQDEIPVVIIAVKNVFEHSRIARNLIKSGIYNIIYKPYAVLKGYGGKASQELFDAHNQIIDYGYCNDGVFCKANEVESRQELQKEYLLDEGADTKTVFLPLPMLFENRDLNEPRKERNVCFLHPHIQFFRYLQGDINASVQYYLEYCEMAAKEMDAFTITDAWKKNVIRNRAEVYHQMNHAFLFQKDFFVRNAPDAEWNESGYFNLKSGKHRAAFFAARKLMYIPVRIKNQDLEKWIHKERLEKVNGFLQQNEVFELKAPIEHPYFYQMPCMAENFFYGLCCALAEIIGDLYYENPMDHVLDQKQIYLNVDDCGFLSRFFRRSGAFVFDGNENDKELTRELGDLFDISVSDQVKQTDFYHMAIIQVNSKEELENYIKEIKADKYFVIAEEGIFSKSEELKKFYCGNAWGKSMEVCYLERSHV